MFGQYKAFIFDMDGTLVDSGQLHEFAWSETLKQFKLPIDRSYMRSLAGVPSLETIDSIIERFNVRVSVPLEEISLFKEAQVQKHFRDYVKPTALIDVVKQYQNKVPMSVGTGAGTSEAEEVLRVCGLFETMQHIVGCDRVTNPKPAPDTFLLCAELMGVTPGDCVVFEDSPAGLKAAESAGMVGVDVLDVLSIENNYFL